MRRPQSGNVGSDSGIRGLDIRRMLQHQCPDLRQGVGKRCGRPGDISNGKRRIEGTARQVVEGLPGDLDIVFRLPQSGLPARDRDLRLQNIELGDIARAFPLLSIIKCPGCLLECRLSDTTASTMASVLLIGS